jgi:hypothetical protein
MSTPAAVSIEFSRVMNNQVPHTRRALSPIRCVELCPFFFFFFFFFRGGGPRFFF